MSTRASQVAANEEVQPHPTSFPDLCPLTGHPRHSRHGRVLDSPPVTGYQATAKNPNMVGKDFGLSGLSFASSSFLRHKTQTKVTTMLDASDVTSTHLRAEATRKCAPGRYFPTDNDTIVYLYDDGDSVEITRVKPCNPSSRSLHNDRTQEASRSRRTSPRTRALRKTATKVSRGGSKRLSRTQSRREAGQDKGKITAYLSSKAPSEELDFQILDNPIARHFPVSRSLNMDPADYMDEPTFAQWLKQCAPGAPEEINEDDEAAAEDFASQDLIVDHLGSLVISSPNVSTSQPQEDIPRPLRARLAVSANELGLRKGMTVELINGSFLLIDSLREDYWGLVTVKGYRLERDTYCGSRLPDGRLNELVWVNEIDEEGHQAGLESVLHEHRASNVKRIRKVLFTNLPWSKVGFDKEPTKHGLNQAPINRATDEDNGELYCRWKYTQVNSRLKTNAEASLTLLKEDEAQGHGRLEGYKVRKMWREGKEQASVGRATMLGSDVNTRRKGSSRQYTLGDSFCGAGGISRGALQAGLQVAWAFDGDDSAIETHKKNFQEHGTKSLAKKDSEFIELVKARPDDYHVDIVHYSPPCQAFSSANHNKNEERDFENQKALFSLYDLNMLLKPRIATVEETAGLMHRHKQWFDTLINIFTRLDYSVRWKILPCKSFGIAQSRVRLLLTAAA